MGRYKATYCYSLFLDSKGEILEAEMKHSAPKEEPIAYSYNAEGDEEAIFNAKRMLCEMKLSGNKAVLESIVKVVFERKK